MESAVVVSLSSMERWNRNVIREDVRVISIGVFPRRQIAYDWSRVGCSWTPWCAKNGYPRPSSLADYEAACPKGRYCQLPLCLPVAHQMIR